MQRSRLQVSCRIALTLINFLIALPPSVVLAMSFTSAFKTDRMNDHRWDAALPEIESIRERVKELRGYLRKYTQRGSWDKADLIVDVLLYVEQWSKVAVSFLCCVCVAVSNPKGMHLISESTDTFLSCRILSYQNLLGSYRIVLYRIVSHRIISYRIV